MHDEGSSADNLSLRLAQCLSLLPLTGCPVFSIERLYEFALGRGDLYIILSGFNSGRSGQLPNAKLSDNLLQTAIERMSIINKYTMTRINIYNDVNINNYINGIIINI